MSSIKPGLKRFVSKLAKRVSLPPKGSEEDYALRADVLFYLVLADVREPVHHVNEVMDLVRTSEGEVSLREAAQFIGEWERQIAN